MGSSGEGARARVIAIVGDQLRHAHVLGRVSSEEGVDLLGYVVEAKRPLPQGAMPTESAVLGEHFARRTSCEQRFFGDAAFPAAQRIDVPFGGSNDPEVARWIDERNPDALVLFGCSIIREHLLERYAGRVINLHLGLSPYYRGAATNFWPLVNGEPECVGATVHLATLEVDGGPILRQVRPEGLLPDDGSHEIGCRAIEAGARALASVVPRVVGGEITGVPQSGDGLLYRNKDFSAGAVETVWQRLDAGLVAEYLAEKAARDARRPIVA